MKCHQRVIRESAAPEPDEGIKRNLAQDFTHASFKEITYAVAKPLVLKYEWLGTTGAARKWVGLFFGEHLAGVEGFGATAGTRVAESIAGVENAGRVCELVRGLCLPWAHPHSASWFIPRACRLMDERYGWNLFVAYATEAAGEFGQIYSSLNWVYTGLTQPSQQFLLNGKLHDSRQVSGLARDRRGHREGEPMKHRRSRAEQRQLLLEQGAVFMSGAPKHRFVGVYGSPAMEKRLRRALKLPSLPFPRRDGLAEWCA
jgi:hypothetical protein